MPLKTIIQAQKARIKEKGNLRVAPTLLVHLKTCKSKTSARMSSAVQDIHQSVVRRPRSFAEPLTAVQQYAIGTPRVQSSGVKSSEATTIWGRVRVRSMAENGG